MASATNGGMVEVTDILLLYEHITKNEVFINFYRRHFIENAGNFLNLTTFSKNSRSIF